MGLIGNAKAFLRRAPVGAAAICALVLAACSSSPTSFGGIDPRYGVAASPRVVEPGQPVPKGGGVYRVGQPYMVAGRMYYPQADPNYRAEGLASWYGEDFHGRLTANGEVYDMHSLSAAHPTLPMPCYARVTNLNNRRSVIVRINDRGPYHANREIDLSGKAAEVLGFRDRGLARVRVEYVGPAALEGSDDRTLLATLREGAPAPVPSVMLASNRPFVPGVPSRSPLMNGAVAPVPAERPFDLGSAPDRQASMADSRVALRKPAPDARVAVSEAPRLQWTPGPPPAAAAYAPAGY
ncbi:MAG TPA: septal ring lytic transglycosylase RlpA family protein, partial [Xanthobacteraceae bacterium]|nr:septal ring lytic transglycosylase RlpA family protein [Xanthobacteraceae bacterium]